VSGVLVVGASQAGHQTAVSLRDAGYGGPITLVGAEPELPYQRPPLSKAVLAGRMAAGELALADPGFYRKRDITVICGERVVELGPAAARTATGREFRFDQLALTVGAEPRRLTVPGADLDGVRHLRDRGDGVTLAARLAAARRVVVVGGGFIGLEAAAVARARGLDVTVVEAADRLIPRAVAPVVSDFYRAAHDRRGVRVLLGVAVDRLSGRDGAVASVHLTDGTELPADLVVVGIGIRPRVELAERAGIACAGGILVDRQARTSRPGVVAAGDCTAQPHPLTGEGVVRLESVQNAVDQARAAAATLAGAPAPAPAVPWFWSDQADLTLQIAGLSQGFDQHVVRGSLADERFSVLYYRAGRLIAVDAVNRPQDYLAVRRALAGGGTIPAAAAGADVPLRTLVRDAG
jgi:3-phenylpropionate/trans-cinnamate dioxygenase ferredoxin reductase subunit